MKSLFFIIIASLLAGCINSSSDKSNTANKNHQAEIKLAKKYEYPISPMNQLDKYDQIVLLVENKEIKEINYTYYVFRDRPSPDLKAKRNSNNYFVLKVIHPAEGIKINADGFKTISIFYDNDISSEQDQDDKFPGILEVKFDPVKKIIQNATVNKI